MDDNPNELADLLAKMFIARPDVKAIQRIINGDMLYTPHLGRDKNRLPWTRSDLLAHISGQQSYGHYLLNQQNQCKLFAFDIDLVECDWNKPERYWYPVQYPTEDDDRFSYEEFCPRTSWRNRAHPSRKWVKLQLRTLAGTLASTIYEVLGIHTAVAYSGNKGLHVYGFTGLMSAYDARVGAQIVLDKVGIFEAVRGGSFFRTIDQDPVNGYPNLSIELFPKQDILGNADGLGNLMRLPLGRNLKTTDPTFFVDLTSELSELAPVDSKYALTTNNPWKRVNE